MPKTHSPDSPTLDDLAERFSVLHQKIRAELSNAVRNALDAGDLLVKARHHVPNCGWIRWLKTHSIPVSTAELYVSLAHNRSKVDAEIDRVGELSLRAARKLVAGPRASRTSSLPRSSVREELEDARRKIAELNAELNRLKQARIVLDKPTLMLIKALSLIKLADDPNTSANSIESNRHEALAVLHVLYTTLVAKNIHPNSIIISASECVQQLRKAA